MNANRALLRALAAQLQSSPQALLVTTGLTPRQGRRVTNHRGRRATWGQTSWWLNAGSSSHA